MSEMPKNRFTEAAAIYQSGGYLETLESKKLPESREEQIAKLKAQIQKLEKVQKSIDKSDRNNEDRKAGKKARLEASENASKTFKVEDNNIWGIDESKEVKSNPKSSSEKPLDSEPKIKKPTTLNEDVGAEHGPKPVIKPEDIIDPSVNKTAPDIVAPTKGPENIPGSENLQKVLRLALSTRGQAGMDAFEAQFKTESRRYKNTKETDAESLRHAEKMFEAEKAFFNSHENFHKTKGFHSVIGDKFNPDGRRLPPEVQKLKEEWLASRSEYAAFLQDEGYVGRDVIKSTVWGAEEAQKRSREKGLSSREKKGIEGFWEKHKAKFSDGMRSVATAAMFTTGAAALTVGSIPLGIGALLLGSASAFTLYKASRAEQGSDAQRKWTTASKIASLFGILPLAGSWAVGRAHEINRTKELAEGNLIKDKYKGNLSDPKFMKKVSEQRRKATLAKEDVEAGQRIGGIAGSALLAGVAAGVGMGEFSGGFEHHHVVDHLSIGGHEGHVYINDADKLLGHFAHKLHHDHFAHGHVPKSLQTLEKHIHFHKGHINGEDGLARRLGLEGQNGSTIMHPHDQIRLLDNGNIILHRPGHNAMDTLLIDKLGHLHKVNSGTWHQAEVSNHAQTHNEEVIPGTPEHQANTPTHESGDNSHDHDHDDVQGKSAEHTKDLQEVAGTTNPVANIRTHEVPTQTVTSTHNPESSSTPDSAYQTLKDNLKEFRAEHPTHHSEAASHTETTPSQLSHPESVPTPVMSNAPVADHFFASTGERAINVHGVDLGKPGMYFYHGRPIAHGISTDDSYTRAVVEAQKLAVSPNHGDAKVFFISHDTGPAGDAQYHLNTVEVPAVGGAPRLVPNYAETPALPSESDYLPLPNTFPQ
jgi:hypothetical protein